MLAHAFGQSRFCELSNVFAVEYCCGHVHSPSYKGGDSSRIRDQTKAFPFALPNIVNVGKLPPRGGVSLRFGV
jgi:hypothetical protein